MARIADLLSPNQRKKYLAGLKGAEREARAAEIVHRREHRSNKPFKTDEGQETHRSSHAAAFERKYGRQAHDVADAAKLTGIPKKILDEVYARGLAAWQTGHRPGASQHAWGLARVYSFATGGPTSRTADRNLAEEAGMRKNPPQPDLFRESSRVEVTRDDLAKHKGWAQEALSLIDKAYAPIGGHANLRSVEDILADDSDVYRFEDIDADFEPDVLQVYKTTPYGRKSVATGNKGTRETKKTTIIDKIEDFRTVGNYGEISGALATRMLAAGVPVIGDRRIVEKVLNKPIKWIGTLPEFPGVYGWYERMIAGHPHAKILVGLPDIVKNPAAAALLRNPADLTWTPEFKRWFGDSKVVDAEGRPLVVYHGTVYGGFTKFDKRMAGVFFFTDNKQMALSYANDVGKDPLGGQDFPITFHTLAQIKDFLGRRENRHLAELLAESDPALYEAWMARLAQWTAPRSASGVSDAALVRAMTSVVNNLPQGRYGLYAAFLSLQNPLIVDAGGSEWTRIPYHAVADVVGRDAVEKAFAQLRLRPQLYMTTDDLVLVARSNQNDGLIVRNCKDYLGRTGPAGDIFVAFEPTQIKSANHNRGTFDPHDADIRNPADQTHIPPGPVAAAARKGLELRAAQPASNRCCTSVGLRRAAQLANRQPVSEDTMRRMLSYFQRHTVDRGGRGWGTTSKGWQAWLCWGGDEGYAWVRRVLGV